MTSLRISKLPDDVLFTIFELLHDGTNGSPDLLNATLVCQRWNHIISQFSRLMSRLKLSINTDDLETDFKLTRQYRSVKLSRKYPQNYSRSSNRDQTNLAITNILKEVEHNANYMTTIELHRIKILPQHIESLSRCELLQTLTVGTLLFDDDNYGQKIGFFRTQQFNFKALRNLKFSKQIDSMRILKYMKCKQLDTFDAFHTYDGGVGSLSECAYCVINFLNQLERCDEILMQIQQFDADLLPKFTWRKIKLKCDMDIRNFRHVLSCAVISSIEALCRASESNSECEITFINFDELEHRLERIWIAIFNNSKIINTLNLYRTPLPTNFKQLYNLDKIKRLDIGTSMLENDDFPKLIAELRNVTQLNIFSESSLDKLVVPVESELKLRSFFNQITDLTLPQMYAYHLPSPPYGQDQNYLFENKFYNLRTLTIQDSWCRFWDGHEPLFVHHYCSNNQNLNHLNVQIGYPRKKSSENQGKINHLNWYSEFHVDIKTCSILVYSNDQTSMNMEEFINWRKAKVDEVELFGKILNDDENRFYV